MSETEQLYRNFLVEDETRLKQCVSIQRKLVVFRMAAFVFTVLPFFILKFPLSAIVSAASFALFLFAVRKSVGIEKIRKQLLRMTQHTRNELEALHHRYSQFDAGTELNDSNHPFSYDLDVFGPGGLFQCLNRTASPLAKKQLAAFLNHPETSVAAINERQAALEELAGKVRWRMLLAALGNLNNEKDLTLLEKNARHGRLKNPHRVKLLITLLPAVTLTALAFSIAGLIPWIPVLMLGVINVAVVSASKKIIDTFYRHFGNQAAILDQYKLLIRHIEDEEFSSPMLIQLKEKLMHDGMKATELIDRLQTVISRFDYRQNFLFIMLAEPLLLWDLRCVYQLDCWQAAFHAHLQTWFDVLARFDALCSLANYNRNNSSSALPELVEGEFCYTASELAHPLLSPSIRVSNDFDMAGNGQMAILTGANMAGKSTFLRTLGINLILAQNGCRVCARTLKLKPVQLFTNMRTTDNLMKSESYFHAELLRLRQILNEIEKGVESFILIDEMLKGTNSTDKLEGSKALTRHLVALRANGIISTHDLKLTDLSLDFPESIRTICFEIRINNDKLEFDYKLKTGVTTTLNADFLMKMMGIIPPATLV